MRYERAARYDRTGYRRKRRSGFTRGILYFAAAMAGAGCVFLFAAIWALGVFQSPAAEMAETTGTLLAGLDADFSAVQEEQAIVIRQAAEQYRAAEQYQAAEQGQTAKQGRAGKETAFRTGYLAPEHPLIVVDPGHGGTDEGCFADGVLEKTINLEIARRLRDRLVSMGYEVVMTREDDAFVTKEQRAEMANSREADAFVSIHQNTYEDAEPEGIETWYDGTDGSRDNKRLARLIHEETVKATGARGRELRGDAEFVVTGWTGMPAGLIETGFLSSPEERKKLAQAEYQEKLAGGIAAGIDSFFHPKTMYLTFDDGPSAENTTAILDILKARNIKATFFVVGENVRKNPEMAKRIAAEGHTIGIHCNRHDYEALYSSTDSFLQDFDKAYQAVYEVTGVKAQLFRFPGGSINAYNKAVYRDIIREMTARGFVYFDWNASLEDALKKSEPGELIANARETAMGRKRVVMLAHDIVHSTALCLEELIDQFPEYQMEPLTTEVKPVQFQP